MQFRYIKIMAVTAFIAFQVNAQDIDPLANFTISKDEISQSLDKLRATGKISEADHAAAKKELAQMNDAQVGSIKDKAIGIVRKDPDKALELINKPTIDAKEVEARLNAAN